MGEASRNIALFEYNVRVTFNDDKPIDVLQFLQKFVESFHRLSICEKEAHAILLFVLKEEALCQF